MSITLNYLSFVGKRVLRLNKYSNKIWKLIYAIKVKARKRETGTLTYKYSFLNGENVIRQKLDFYLLVSLFDFFSSYLNKYTRKR